MAVNHYGVFSTSPLALAHDIVMAYRESNDHSTLAHETARVNLINLIGNDGFSYSDYKIWSQRLNDIDANRPLTSSFIGSKNYRPL